MLYDRISKPAKGRYFPIPLTELKNLLHSYSFNQSYAKDCLSVFMENCEVETLYGYQLCSFFRNRYFASFSLPEVVAFGLSEKALTTAIEKLSVIDKGPRRSLNEQQFMVYRVYLGELSELIFTEHIVNGKSRSYLRFDDARKLSKTECGSKSEKILFKVKIA